MLRAPTRILLSRSVYISRSVYLLPRTMATAQRTTLDVQHEIKTDHDNIRDLWDRYQACKDHDEKMRIANTMIREMAVHGDAEELSYYNYLEKHGKGNVSEHSKEEHHQLKVLIHDADTTTAGPDFDQKLAKAYQAFEHHAKEEEGTILPEMASKMSAEENDAEARNFLKARTMGPARPHPSAPQTGGMLQKMAAAQAAVHDKIVNTLRGTDYVPLKYHHPERF